MKHCNQCQKQQPFTDFYFWHWLYCFTDISVIHSKKKNKSKRIRLEVNSEKRGWQKGSGNQLRLWKEDETLVMLSPVAQPCLTLCDPMNRSTPGLPVYHQLPEFTQTQVHWVGHAIQPSHPRSPPSPPAPNPSQHQSLFQWVNSSHEVAKVLEIQL